MSSNQPSAGNISDNRASSFLDIHAMLSSINFNEEGKKCMNAAKFKEASEKFGQAIALYPSPTYYCNRAGAYGAFKQYNDAFKDYHAAIELDPNYAKAYGDLGFVFTFLNRYNEAIEAFKKALEFEPENEEYKQDLATVEEKLKAVKQEPTTPASEVTAKANALKEEGNQYMKASKFKEAIEKYTQALELKRDPVFLCNRAAAHCRLKQYNDAVNDCTNALLLDSNYAKAYGRFGFVHSCKGLYFHSAEMYQKALNLDPTNDNYKENLALAKAKAREANQGP